MIYKQVVNGAIEMQGNESSEPAVTVVDSRRPSVIANLSPLKMIGSVSACWPLIWRLAMRDASARYRGAQLGLLWSILNPLLLLAVYTYVFCVVMKAKWNGAGPENYFSFALTLFAGLTAFNIFSEVVSRAPSLVLSCPNYVKKVVFPLEILPVIALVVALTTFFASFIVLVPAMLILQGVPSWTILLYPLALLPLILLALGLGWLLASLGVFLRDIGQSISLVLQLLVFMTPIFYPVSAIPHALRPVLVYNPLAVGVESFRRVVLWGQQPDWTMLAAATLIGLVCCQLGYAFFMVTKKAFADVI